MTKSSNFQSIFVPYPKRLYASAIWLNSRRRLPFFLHKMHKNLKSLKEYSSEAVEEIRRLKGYRDFVSDTIFVFELTYVKSYTLKKKMWQKLDLDLSYDFRYWEFINAVDKPDLYYLLASPQINIGKNNTFEYNAAFTFLKSKQKEIDMLTQISDVFVNPEAKNAAIFRFSDLFSYDLIEGKRINKSEEYIS